jgi:hypothetical protein
MALTQTIHDIRRKNNAEKAFANTKASNQIDNIERDIAMIDSESTQPVHSTGIKRSQPGISFKAESARQFFPSRWPL